MQHLMQRAVYSLRPRARDRSPVVDRSGASDARARDTRVSALRLSGGPRSPRPGLSPPAVTRPIQRLGETAAETESHEQSIAA